MIGLIFLVLVTAVGAISLRYFLIRNKSLPTGYENAEAINLVTEMANIWKSDKSASEKMQRLSAVRDKIIDFDNRRKKAAVSYSEENVTYLDSFKDRHDGEERKRSGAN